ncbi:hypothetical protein PFMALIP_00430 [Plasmodium falciparum MaliPS096_E11]|uniref:Uncharacterized protein n=3 Tax=Plasmodium falciparum TaxID=5833 RepID=W7K0E7_PLAFO|nr:hypothetical protein PFMALIP_00430 [Plasmodium falciparum MaliPS096_E11]EWC90738.1 hypothetical protein PFNF54_00384 [Plasmodium falciparum NF54]
MYGVITFETIKNVHSGISYSIING